jgi:hypothetical protein
MLGCMIWRVTEFEEGRYTVGQRLKQSSLQKAKSSTPAKTDVTQRSDVGSTDSLMPGVDWQNAQFG